MSMNRYSSFEEATIEANMKTKLFNKYYTAVKHRLGYWMVSMRYDIKFLN